MITLGSGPARGVSAVTGSARVAVDEEHGGRLASLVVHGRERLVTRERTDGDSLVWGAYPMVPWAGRVRDGRFSFGGRTVDLPRRLPPHAIHGTVFERPWTVDAPSADAPSVDKASVDKASVDAASADEVTIRTDLGPHWPWRGHVTHRVTLVRHRRDAVAVRCRLTVHADDEPFPAQVGWHPWFADAGGGDTAGTLPPHLTFSAQAMYRRDGFGLPDGTTVHPGPHPWDDCFVGVTDAPRLRYRDGLVLTLASDCDYWVVYEPDHAVCVEPQSGPPDGFTLAPHVVEPGRPLSRTFEIVWGT